MNDRTVADSTPTNAATANVEARLSKMNLDAYACKPPEGGWLASAQPCNGVCDILSLSKVWQVNYDDVSIWDTAVLGYFAIRVRNFYTVAEDGQVLRLPFQEQGRLHISLCRGIPVSDRAEHVQLKAHLFIKLAEYIATQLKIGYEAIAIHFVDAGANVAQLCENCSAVDLCRQLQQRILQWTALLDFAGRNFNRIFWPIPHISFDMLEPRDQIENVQELDGEREATEAYRSGWCGKGKFCKGCAFTGFSSSHWLKGVVTYIADYGVFVDVKEFSDDRFCLSALVHRSQMKRPWMWDLHSQVKLGQDADVRILSLQRTQSKLRLSLSMQDVARPMGLQFDPAGKSS
jgi:hypothetical protein